MTNIVILGAGTAGTIMANRLARMYKSELRAGRTRITVVDQEERHVYQPGLLFVPFGIYSPDEIVRERGPSLPEEVEYVSSAIERVEAEENTVYLADGSTLSYDLLVIATGTRIAPEETEGLTGEGWGTRMFEFYTLEGATALASALRNFDGGRLVVNVVDMPIKCPVAPLEFAFLADAYFTDRGIRDKVEIVYATPLDGAFTKPLASGALGHLLDEKGIQLVTEFNTGQADGESGRLISWDEREELFDLLVSIPLHTGAEFVGRSTGLGDDLDFVLTDANTLQAQVKSNIFVLGDATNVPTSKAGSVAHFQAEILEENIRAYLAGDTMTASFDGHANCFIETGFKKALLIDFNYDVEPLPGRFPLPVIGPMSLLKPTRLNHMGKMMFKWVYWNMLLPGHSIPGVPPNMTMYGKKKVGTEPTTTRAA